MVRVRTCVPVLALVVAACVASPDLPVGTPSPSRSASTTAEGPTPVATTVGREADLERLVEAFAAHPEPPDLTGAAAELRDRADALTPAQFLVEVMRLTAGRDGDGHTGAFPLGQPELELWPLQLYAFDDGWRVVAAMEPYGDLVGGAVTEVGGVPVDDAAEQVAPLVSRDDPASLLGRLPQYLVVPAVLEGLGLGSSITIDGETLTPDPVSAETYAAWSDLFYPLVCPPLPRPTDELLAVDRVDGAVVVRLRRTVAAAGGRTVAGLARDVLDAVEGVGEPILVLDLRDNPGGENGSYAPLLVVAEQVAAEHPGAVRLIVNRCTFSAASNFVAQVLAAIDATVVGETMGGATRQWGDARPTRLPSSGIVVHIATRWHELGSADVPTVVEPDVAVAVTWADREAGRDASLDAAIER